MPTELTVEELQKALHRAAETGDKQETAKLISENKLASQQLKEQQLNATLRHDLQKEVSYVLNAEYAADKREKERVVDEALWKELAAMVGVGAHRRSIHLTDSDRAPQYELRPEHSHSSADQFTPQFQVQEQHQTNILQLPELTLEFGQDAESMHVMKQIIEAYRNAVIRSGLTPPLADTFRAENNTGDGFRCTLKFYSRKLYEDFQEEWSLMRKDMREFKTTVAETAQDVKQAFKEVATEASQGVRSAYEEVQNKLSEFSNKLSKFKFSAKPETEDYDSLMRPTPPGGL